MSAVFIQIELKNDNTMTYNSTSLNNITNLGLLEMAKHLVMTQCQPKENGRIVAPEINGWKPEHTEGELLK